MIRVKFYILILLTIQLTNIAEAQFVNIEFEIEPELSASVEQNLSFGEQIAGAGQIDINLGDLNVGIFSIRAINTQSLHVMLNYPESLINSSNFTGDGIFLNLKLAYNIDENNARTSTTLPNSLGLINLNEHQTNDSDIWKLVYIYVFGSIEIGNVSPGIYEGNIHLNIEYF